MWFSMSNQNEKVKYTAIVEILIDDPPYRIEVEYLKGTKVSALINELINNKKIPQNTPISVYCGEKKLEPNEPLPLSKLGDSLTFTIKFKQFLGIG